MTRFGVCGILSRGSQESLTHKGFSNIILLLVRLIGPLGGTLPVLHHIATFSPRRSSGRTKNWRTDGQPRSLVLLALLAPRPHIVPFPHAANACRNGGACNPTINIVLGRLSASSLFHWFSRTAQASLCNTHGCPALWLVVLGRGL